VRLWAYDAERTLADLPQPLPPGALLPQPLLDGDGDWEVEIGFGKGRYLLRRAAAEPEGRFLGIEVAQEYHEILVDRARRRGLRNIAAARGEAQTLLSAVLPHGFARAVHVYFPDPWPKARHERRRLFAPESVDLVLSLLRPGGILWFATDFVAYGEVVRELLEAHPRTRVTVIPGAWPAVGPQPAGPRTNYEAKYVQEGRQILRLAVEWSGAEGLAAVHPRGVAGVLAAYRADGVEAA